MQISTPSRGYRDTGWLTCHGERIAAANEQRIEQVISKMILQWGSKSLRGEYGYGVEAEAAANQRHEALLARHGIDPPADTFCMICREFGRVPYAECWYCGDSPSWHHGRCCPERPEPETDAGQGS